MSDTMLGGEMITGKSIEKTSNDTKRKIVRFFRNCSALLISLASYVGIFFAILGLACLYTKYLGDGNLEETMCHIGIVALCAWIVYFINKVTGFVYIEKEKFMK